MATLSFGRKRKPAGLTTSYELKDHMVATDANNAYLNPHPQYVLRSELISGGGGSSSSDIVLHMADPAAHANYYVQLEDVTDTYTSYTTGKVASNKAVYDVYTTFNGHDHDTVYSKLGHTHEYLSASDIVDDLSATGTDKTISATQIAGFYTAYLNHNHNTLYIAKTSISGNYSEEDADGANKVLSIAGAYAFYQEYLVHDHGDIYAAKVHTHDDILTNDSLLIHDASQDAHPGLFIHKNHIVAATNIPATTDPEHVVAYSFFSALYEKVYDCFMAQTTMVKTVTSDTTFVDGKTYYTYDDTTDTFSEATVTAGTAIVGTYYEDTESITGPSAVNPLRSIFASIVHTHTYQDVGAAPAVHTHDDLYSPLDHDHDDRYSLIHSHPYLSDSVLDRVGIYPEMAICDKTITSNPNYDPEDPMSDENITEDRDLNEETEQGLYHLNHVPVNVPSRNVLIPELPDAQDYVGLDFTYMDGSTEQTVHLSMNNLSSYIGMYGKIPCGVGQLTVKTVKLKTAQEIEDEEINNIPYRYYQTYIDDESGAVLQRIGNNTFTDDYILTASEQFEDGVTYYILNASDEYEEAEVTVGDPIPADTYYERNGTTQSVVWGNWKEIGCVEGFYAPLATNRTYLTSAAACKCCFSKTDGANYIDFIVPDSVSTHLTTGNIDINILFKCITDQSTYGYANGDIIVNPIVSNKADNESSFLGHAQVSLQTVSGQKVLRLYLPLAWYVKVSDQDAESNVTLTSSNIYKYYRREFTYDNEGEPTTEVIDDENAAMLVGTTGDFAAVEYGSKSVPVATQAECAEWSIQLRMKY